MQESLYEPIPTEEIPLPIVEAPRTPRADQAPLPRALLQAEGRRLAVRRVLIFTGVFLFVSVFEAAIFLRLGDPTPLVVYRELPETVLVEADKR